MSQSWCLATLYLLAVLSGVRNIYYWIPSDLDQVLPTTFGVIVFLWAKADARRRGRPFPLTSASWIFVFAPLAVPGYLIWSRGWRGLLFLALNWLALTILSLAVMHAGGYLWFRNDWLRAFGWKG